MAEFISLDSGKVSQGVIKFLKVDNKMVSAAQLALVCCCTSYEYVATLWVHPLMFHKHNTIEE